MKLCSVQQVTLEIEFVSEERSLMLHTLKHAERMKHLRNDNVTVCSHNFISLIICIVIFFPPEYC